MLAVGCCCCSSCWVFGGCGVCNEVFNLEDPGVGHAKCTFGRLKLDLAMGQNQPGTFLGVRKYFYFFETFEMD